MPGQKGGWGSWPLVPTIPPPETPHPAAPTVALCAEEPQDTLLGTLSPAGANHRAGLLPGGPPGQPLKRVWR